MSSYDPTTDLRIAKEVEKHYLNHREKWSVHQSWQVMQMRGRWVAYAMNEDGDYLLDKKDALIIGEGETPTLAVYNTSMIVQHTIDEYFATLSQGDYP